MVKAIKYNLAYVDEENVKLIKARIRKFKKDFPEAAKSKLEYVGTFSYFNSLMTGRYKYCNVDFDFEFSLETFLSTTAFYNHTIIYGMFFNEILFRKARKELLEAKIKQTIEHGKAFKNYSVTSLIDHELGHCVSTYIGEKRTFCALIDFFEKNTERIKEDLGGYATEDVFELIAEAFAEVRTSRTPCEISKYVYSVLVKLYKNAAENKKPREIRLCA